jgi:hypothetical protein
MSFLMEKNGERAWALTREGREDWTVLREGPGTKPRENYDLVDGEWVLNTTARTAFDRRARFNNMTREELVDFILAVIKKGDARLDALETSVTALQAALNALQPPAPAPAPPTP